MPDNIQVGIRLTADGKQLVGEVRRGRKTLTTFTREVQKTGRAAHSQTPRLNRFATRMREIGRESGAATSSMQAFKRIAAVVVSGVTIRALAQTAIQYQRIDRTLQTVFGSTSAARREFQFIEEQAGRLGLRLATTAQDYAKLSAAAQGTTLEGQQLRDIFISVNEASTVLGLTADQTSGALTAIEQIISKGVVSAEELRGQLGERIPGAFQVAARAMGVTTQELGKMLESGDLLAEDLLPRLADEFSNLYSEDAVAASREATGQINRFRNELDNLAKSFGSSGFLDEIADAMGEISDAFASPQAQEGMRLFGSAVASTLKFMVNNSDVLIAVGTALSFGALGRLIGRAGNKIADLAGKKPVISPGVAGTVGTVAGGVVGLNLTNVGSGSQTSSNNALQNQLRSALQRAGYLDGGSVSNDPVQQDLGGGDSGSNAREIEQAAAAHGRAIASIIARQRELLPVLDQNILKLSDWRDATLAGLDKSKAGYEDFKEEVERIYSQELSALYDEDAALQAAAEQKKLEKANMFTHGIQLGIARMKEDAQSTAEQIADAFGRGFQSMEDALANFVATGKLNFGSLTQSIISDLARIAIRQSITTPLLGFLGDLFKFPAGTPSATALAGASRGVPGPFIQHAGGIVGSTNLRRGGVPLAEFLGARRYHGGGIAHNEVPAILQRGEEVLRRDDPRHQLNKNAMPVQVQIINEGTPQRIQEAQATSTPEAFIIGVITENVRADGQVAQTIGATYGLKRRDY